MKPISKGLLLVVAGMLLVACQITQAVSAAPEIPIRIKVVGDDGKPIPYVTIWATSYWPGIQSSVLRQPLDAVDLWRISLRYQYCYDLVTDFNEPLDGLSVYMADSQGSLDSGAMFRVGMPQSATFAYTFMKRGYQPARLVFTLDSASKGDTFTTTMHRDPGEAMDTAPYLKTLELVRYQVSDRRKNEDISIENYQRLEGLRADMEQAAQQALAAGDNKSAARIYARIETLPEITLINGKPVGYSSNTSNTSRGRAAIAQAIKSDPSDPYMRMRSIRDNYAAMVGPLSYPLTADDQHRLSSYVSWELKMISEIGDEMWPGSRLGLVYNYRFLQKYDEAYKTIQELRAWEPKATDYDAMINDLKDDMRRHNAPIPDTWH